MTSPLSKFLVICSQATLSLKWSIHPINSNCSKGCAAIKLIRHCHIWITTWIQWSAFNSEEMKQWKAYMNLGTLLSTTITSGTPSKQLRSSSVVLEALVQTVTPPEPLRKSKWLSEHWTRILGFITRIVLMHLTVPRLRRTKIKVNQWKDWWKREKHHKYKESAVKRAW